MFKNKTLLITGGIGSFGNAVLKRFLDTDIKEIRILSRDEKTQDDMLLRICSVNRHSVLHRELEKNGHKVYVASQAERRNMQDKRLIKAGVVHLLEHKTRN